MTLVAIESNGDFGVRDSADGISVWWPDAEAQAEIQSNTDPRSAAVKMCELQPNRGTWCN